MTPISSERTVSSPCGKEQTETDDDLAEEDTSTTEQQALAKHVAMYNAVNDTSEKLSTAPNGDSTCDECSQELKFSKAEGPRTASKHFASKKHKLARKKALKPLVLERTHTSNDMYRVLGLPTFAEKIKASSCLPIREFV